MVRKIIIMISVIIVVCIIGSIFGFRRAEKNDTTNSTNTDITNHTQTMEENIENVVESSTEATTTQENNPVEKVEDNKIQDRNNKIVGNSSNKENLEKSNPINENKIIQETNNDNKQSQVNQKVEEIQTEVEEEKPVEITKEEYIYNSTETKRLIDDIDEIAKRNSSLWNKDGSKKYEIEIASSLVGGNYMYPYSKAQLEGIVLNVFSVKFLVYAVDYHKTGFATETRYYIDIAEYSNK